MKLLKELQAIPLKRIDQIMSDTFIENEKRYTIVRENARLAKAISDIELDDVAKIALICDTFNNLSNKSMLLQCEDIMVYILNCVTE